ncbi:LysR family transcriptional regulator [Vibrio sp. YMD68]|uniref:LysR family transcriptional regulator n=1 Tax=Vibrio sp. YMD68 TaxID=3042300 RepID=UPI00249C7071|nr:LysR family transcriptional regulator [Vibrio sp. YMD68]WGV99223.1 LysR family transcriptional regulator [Vibrio sp. YMD68]
MPKSNHFDFNLLRVFLSVYKTHSYSQSAEALDLTPSAVSHAIKRLNTQLSETLFQRTNIGVEPTFVAHDFYKQIAAPYMDIEQSLSSYEKFDPYESKRTFQVLVPDIYMPVFAARLDKENDTNCQIICIALPAEDEQIYDLLMSGEVDLALDYVLPSLAGINSEMIYEEEICCVARKEHPRVKLPLGFEDYMAESHAKLNLRRWSHRAADTLAKRALPQRKTHSEHNSLYSMVHTLASSDALGICPKRLAQDLQKTLPIDILPIPFEINNITVWLHWPKKVSNNPANKWLRDIVRKAWAEG